jgi:hypothetical protein
MSTTDPVQEAFAEAQQAFRRKLKNQQAYDEILTTTTAAEIYQACTKLQEDTMRKGRLRYLGKIGSFLEKLSSYAAVIEVFVQVQPELLALIWGPIKIVLQWSSYVNKALDEVTDVMQRIGQSLPQFAVLFQTLGPEDSIKSALVMFYEDILDFYCVLLQFFRTSREYSPK